MGATASEVSADGSIEHQPRMRNRASGQGAASTMTATSEVSPDGSIGHQPRMRNRASSQDTASTMPATIEIGYQQKMRHRVSDQASRNRSSSSLMELKHNDQQDHTDQDEDSKHTQHWGNFDLTTKAAK